MAGRSVTFLCCSSCACRFLAWPCQRFTSGSALRASHPVRSLVPALHSGAPHGSARPCPHPTHPPPLRRRYRRRRPALAATAATAHARDRRPRRAAAYPPTHWIPASTSNYRVSSRPTAYPIEFVMIHVTQETFPDAVKIFQDPPDRSPPTTWSPRPTATSGSSSMRRTSPGTRATRTTTTAASASNTRAGWTTPPGSTDERYASSAALTAAVCDRFAIPKDRDHIIAHSEVPGADHTDPGPLWDWDR